MQHKNLKKSTTKNPRNSFTNMNMISIYSDTHARDGAKTTRTGCQELEMRDDESTSGNAARHGDNEIRPEGPRERQFTTRDKNVLKLVADQNPTASSLHIVTRISAPLPIAIEPSRQPLDAAVR